MHRSMKKLLSSICLVLLLFSILSPSPMVLANESQIEQAVSEISLETNLIDQLVTKADKLTFDLWARDHEGKKIDTSQIKVTNNDQAVSINWDDTEKTSYTLDLEIGQNIVVISVNAGDASQVLRYTITREYAEDGDVIGQFVFAMEAFTIGIGYIIEPQLVDIIKGENAAQTLDRILKDEGFDYEHTGSLTGSFYLATLLDGHNKIFKKEPKIPEPLKEALNGMYNEDGYSDGMLGEFDFNSLSGWMYAVNNIFPNVGFADYYLNDGDVMRVQFTIALGSDLGGGWGINFFESVSKDDLTKKIAEINCRTDKADYFAHQSQQEAYENAISVLEKVNASQEEIDQALESIQQAELVRKEEEANKEKAQEVMTKIDHLPSLDEITLEDRAQVEAARQAFDRLTEGQQALVENLDSLIQLESRLEELEKQALDQEKAATVVDLIKDLPSLGELTLEDRAQVEAARQAFDRLTEGQQALVENLDSLIQLESHLEELEKQALDQEKAATVVDLIKDLPSLGTVTLEDRVQIEAARQAFDRLTEGQQNLVSNLDKLIQLEALLDELEAEKLENQAAAQAVQEMIAQLPDIQSLHLDDKEGVEKALHAYYALTDEQKDLVTNVDMLLGLQEKLNELEEIEEGKQAVMEVVQKIASLPELERISLEYKETVASIRQAYVSLDDGLKSLVDNLDKLEKIEKKLQELEVGLEQDKDAAEEVSLLIETLPDLEILTLEDREKVEKVREAFNQLSERARSYVVNIDTLVELETALKEREEALTLTKETLESFIHHVTILDLTDKTLESVQLVEEALSKAQLVLENEEASQEELDRALEELQLAVAALETKEPEEEAKENHDELEEEAKENHDELEEEVKENHDELEEADLDFTEENLSNSPVEEVEQVVEEQQNDQVVKKKDQLTADKERERLSIKKGEDNLTDQEKNGRVLPSTASHLYSIILIGACLILLALAIGWISRRQALR